MQLSLGRSLWVKQLSSGAQTLWKLIQEPSLHWICALKWLADSSITSLEGGILFLTHRGRELVGHQRKKHEEEWKSDPKVLGPVFSKEHINCFPPQKMRGSSRHTSTAPQVYKSSAGMLLLTKKKRRKCCYSFPLLKLSRKPPNGQQSRANRFYKPKLSS